MTVLEPPALGSGEKKDPVQNRRDVVAEARHGGQRSRYPGGQGLRKKPSASGLVLPAFSNSLSSSFCLAVRLVGVSTLISMYMSPRWVERMIGMPLARRRNWWPLWAPGRDVDARRLAVERRHLDRCRRASPAPSRSAPGNARRRPRARTAAWRRTDRKT